MRKWMKRVGRIGSASMLASVLVACGGGGSSGTDLTPANPAANWSRSTSSDGTVVSSSESDSGSTGTSSTTSTTTTSTAASTSTATGSYTLLAWNDLGMHCVDGKDYSVFSILPPYNNLHAQLVKKAGGGLVTSGVKLTYEAMADSTGSINTSSAGKTNFWTYVKTLYGAYFGGINPAPNVGLKGNPTTSTTPRAMSFDSTNKWFAAEGIPITPYDDSGAKNFYPMVKVVAKDTSGKILATARTVLPVSDEMTCKACHASTSTSSAAKPAAGWVNDTVDPEKDWKKNILRLHDEKQMTNPTFLAALVNAKTLYSPNGLFATAASGKPVLCAACHSSNALPGTGLTGIEPLTQALHSKHASVKDPSSLTGQTLGDSTNRAACYMCHPGSVTQCLRGPMGNATVTVNGIKTPAMNCQSCHGSMAAVGDSTRTGWLNQPTCQSCHHDGKRELNSLTAVVSTDQRFASNANTPAAGFNLYRFSTGHGGLQCESCHGATHAEYTSSEINDNVLSKDVQSHTGTIAECTACHSTVPTTVKGGPHGMHTTGSAWVSSHHDYAKGTALTDCAYCHGADYRGTALSQVKMAKTFSVDGRSKTYAAGQTVSCYDCHNGPTGGD